MTIRFLATSLSGSEHILTGGVRDRKSYEWQTEEEARAHMTRIGWTDQRIAVKEFPQPNGVLRVVWSNKSVTEHLPGSGDFLYIEGGNQQRKISKSLDS